ncbi:gliding motility-associated C-terminal domain-containing protein [Mucilaginibacter sp. UYCu711]|uniref:T9SS type B sorting domain-containing protein n=1 Tax=Mucilaginibacter sp. UYCu711 TaxID=3156339 RepID=UPI003D1DE8CB
MYLNKLVGFLALLLILPILSFGQTVPVAPSMLLDIGGLRASAISTSLKFDAQGNFYVIGNYVDGPYNVVDFDPSAGITGATEKNAGDFLAKYSAAGALVWVKRFEQEWSGVDASGLDIDRNGNITVIGRKDATGTRNAAGYVFYSDAFIVHLDNNGNVLWEKLIESGSRAIPTDIGPNKPFYDGQIGYKVASDAAGNLIGLFAFWGSPDVSGKITAKGSPDGLVVKYDPNGNVIWKFNLGAIGNGYDNRAVDVLVDKDNNIIVAGYGNGTVDYNPLGAPVSISGEHAIFLAKYSPAGILQWVKSNDGLTFNYNVTLALDSQDNIYINGVFNGPTNFGSTPTLNPIGLQDIFIAKYSSAGNLLYRKDIGGTNTTVLNRGMAVGTDNSLYLTGNFLGKVDFDPSSAVAELTAGVDLTMFLAKYDDNGNYQWAFAIPDLAHTFNSVDINSVGPSIEEEGVQFLNVNSNNEIFVTGQFGTSKPTINFDATGCGIGNLTVQGKADMFIVRYVPTTLVPVTNNTATAPAVTTVCPGDDPGLITGSTPIGSNYTYQWQQSLDNKTFTDIPGASAQSKDFDPPVISATTYYRRGILKAVCAAPNVSNVITINYIKPVTDNRIVAPSDSNFCNVGNAALIRGYVPVAVGNIDYQWQQSTDNITFTDINGATAKDYDPSSASITTYYRRLITNSPCNIRLPGNTVTIAINPLPVATVSPEQSICPGQSVTLNATGGTSYLWSPATGLSATDVASPIATLTTATTYTVTVFNGDCSSTLTVTVNVAAPPLVNAGPDKTIFKGDRVQLTGQVTATAGTTYQWSPATYLDDPNSLTPIATPAKNITYKLTATTAKGYFVVNDDVSIRVLEKIKIPNTFTPNGDNVNDSWLIDGLDGYNDSIITVFNRLGQKIFNSIGYAKPWDGMLNNRHLPLGTYYYIIDLKNGQGPLSGYVMLLK